MTVAENFDRLLFQFQGLELDDHIAIEEFETSLRVVLAKVTNQVAALEFIEQGKHWPDCWWFSHAIQGGDAGCDCDQRTARDGVPDA